MYTTLACGWFERQDHETNQPEIPTYKVSGYIKNAVSGDGIAGLELLIYQYESYDGGWIDQTITYSQEDGSYQFEDVPRGAFNLFIYDWEGNQIKTMQFGIIQYQDKIINAFVTP